MQSRLHHLARRPRPLRRRLAVLATALAVAGAAPGFAIGVAGAAPNPTRPAVTVPGTSLGSESPTSWWMSLLRPPAANPVADEPASPAMATIPPVTPITSPVPPTTPPPVTPYAPPTVTPPNAPPTSDIAPAVPPSAQPTVPGWGNRWTDPATSSWGNRWTDPQTAGAWGNRWTGSEW